MIYFRKITTVGERSSALVIPVDVMRELGWKKGQRMAVEFKGKREIRLLSEIDYRKERQKKGHGPFSEILKKLRIK